jgi:hypothetical protein
MQDNLKKEREEDEMHDNLSLNGCAIIVKLAKGAINGQNNGITK